MELEGSYTEDEMNYEWRVYNNMKKEYQFPSIKETSMKKAERKLFKLIGDDARKWRFEFRKVKKNGI